MVLAVRLFADISDAIVNLAPANLSRRECPTGRSLTSRGLNRNCSPPKRPRFPTASNKTATATRSFVVSESKAEDGAFLILSRYVCSKIIEAPVDKLKKKKN